MGDGSYRCASCASAAASGATALLAQIAYYLLSRRQFVTYRNGAFATDAVACLRLSADADAAR